MTTTIPPETGGLTGTDTVNRQYSTGTALGLAFIIVSPVIALFAILHMLVATDGPRAALGIGVVLIGQILICLSLAEMAAKWPVQGGIYQWVVRTIGVKAGWISGFLYMWTLIIALASLAVACMGFADIVLGVTMSTTGRMVFALAFIAAAVLLNVIGPTLLKIVVAVSVGMELIASVGISLVLLVFHRHQPFSALFQPLPASAGTAAGGAAILSVMAIAGWAFLAFESATDLAEEVRHPRKALPVAMLGALLSVGALVLLSYIAIVLAIPDYEALLASGEDPAAYALDVNLGAWAPTVFYALVLTSFFAGAVGIVAGAARVAWSYAREGRLPGSRQLGKLKTARALPIPAMIMAGVVAALIVVLSLADTIYTMLVSFVTFGFFQAMWLALYGRMYQVVRRRWQPHPGGYRLGRASTPLAVAAFLWCSFELVNVAWPRDTGSPWYVEWATIVVFVVLSCLGILLASRYSVPRTPPVAVAQEASR
ncbi:amino acid permease [Mycolicibacterium litorale]|uniref:Amino acid permease n=1 Tax=Mycolicibacterium litorale TaxID=758802 RepID=A0A6S6P2K9_9MYCO|nr:APC family permease [Mycolicibacterium litorale]BCI51577.1 amino acid permease [Mycolicibacterium litorale]